MKRVPEPEIMDIQAEVEAYALADFAEVNRAFVERLLLLADGAQAAVALDLGCGPGDIPVRVARARPDWHVVAVDFSGSMLDVAQRASRAGGLAGRVEFVRSDAKAVGLQTRSFDVIFSNSLLHHLSQVSQWWAEIRRLGTPGATILVRDLARPAGPEAARKIVDHYAGKESPLLREEYYRSLLAAYVPEEVLAQLESAGLATLQVTMASDRHLDVFGRLP